MGGSSVGSFLQSGVKAEKILNPIAGAINEKVQPGHIQLLQQERKAASDQATANAQAEQDRQNALNASSTYTGLAGSRAAKLEAAASAAGATGTGNQADLLGDGLLGNGNSTGGVKRRAASRTLFE